MKVLQFNKAQNLEEALKILDTLRADLESGKIVCFTGVGIARDDCIYRYQASALPVSYLRIVGALDFHKNSQLNGDD